MKTNNTKGYKLTDYDLIIFDCDGTLVDSEPISNSVIGKLIRELGLQITDKEAHDLFVGTSFETINDYLKSKINGELKFDLEKEFRIRSTIRFKEELQPIEGALEFIQKINKTICVASNGPKKKMVVTLGATGMLSYFNQNNMFSAYDLGKWKPEPDLFLHACKSMNVPPERSVVIEDTLPGVMGAINAKIDVIAIGATIEKAKLKELAVPNFESYSSLMKHMMC